MAGIPPIKIRGIRQSIPPGYVLGRTSPGSGDAELIPIGRIGQTLVTTGIVAAGPATGGTPGQGGGGGSGGSSTPDPNVAKALQQSAYAASLDPGGSDGDPGPPGPAGATGATGPPGVGAQGPGSNIPGIDGEDGQDAFTYQPTVRYPAALTFVYDGSGASPTNGTTIDLYVPFAGTILSATLQADISGSAVVAVWAQAGIGSAPTSGQNIAASAPPTLTSAIASQDATLTGWTRSFVAGTWFRTSLTSSSTLTRITLTLSVLKA